MYAARAFAALADGQPSTVAPQSAPSPSLHFVRES